MDGLDGLLEGKELAEVLERLEVRGSVEGLLVEFVDFAVLERKHVAVGGAKCNNMAHNAKGVIKGKAIQTGAVAD